jgi:cytochrome c5
MFKTRLRYYVIVSLSVFTVTDLSAVAQEETGTSAVPYVEGTPRAPKPAQAATQDSWRLCNKCHLMFYDGYPNKGRCAAGGGHVATGFNFILPYNAPEAKQAQAAWRYCGKCHAMFYDGYPSKGACAAGGGHVAAGFNFVLPHDVPPRGAVQAAWRYCGKCHAMFYDGSPNKGRCAAGGGHVAAGFNFVLRYH